MDVLTAVALVLLGLALLAGGGEALVRAATTLAELAGVTPAVIGLTVVAIGTSLPELVVSLVAAMQEEPELAVANVVGSNIFNIAAILGVTALLIPLPVHGSAVRLEWPVMCAASLLCQLLARDGLLDRNEGGFFLVAIVLFIAYTVHVARADVRAAEARQLAEQVEERAIDVAAPATNAETDLFGRTDAGHTTSPRLLITFVVLVIGIGALVAGGHLLVDGAVALARIAGVTERVIGLTIVAGGTGTPELATSLIAAARKRTDLAIANIIGSNIFNILGILGIAAVVAPIPVSAALVHSDMWWMLGTAILLLPLMRSGARLSRLEGALLVGVYVVYLVMLLRV